MGQKLFVCLTISSSSKISEIVNVGSMPGLAR